METPCLCPSEGHKHGGRKVTETVLLLKRKIIALELRHLELNVSSSASTVQLAKTKVITHLLTYATAFSGNLVPRVSHLTAPWGERGQTLVWSGHVCPRIKTGPRDPQVLLGFREGRRRLKFRLEHQ